MLIEMIQIVSPAVIVCQSKAIHIPATYLRTLQIAFFTIREGRIFLKNAL